MRIDDVKHCNRCKSHKLRAEFTENWTRPSGLNDWCKQCMREYRQLKKRAKQCQPAV